jgi:1-pyrroline-5-carboxylate dehydrogenase
MDTTHERVTYATLAAGQTPEFHRRFDEALSRVRSDLGARHPHRIDGREVAGEGESLDTSPIDTRVVVGRFPKGTPGEVDAAVRGGAAFPASERCPYRERTEILRRAADLIEERGFDLSAWSAWRSQQEPARGHGDVTETADHPLLLRADGAKRRLRSAHGPFQRERGDAFGAAAYGVWGVISFNFPAALGWGRWAGAGGGNTVVIAEPRGRLPALPSRGLREAGCPPRPPHRSRRDGGGQAWPPTGGGRHAGSRAAGGGMELLHLQDYQPSRRWGQEPRHRDAVGRLDAAAEGVMRSRRPLGQKCTPARGHVRGGGRAHDLVEDGQDRGGTRRRRGVPGPGDSRAGSPPRGGGREARGWEKRWPAPFAARRANSRTAS